MRGERFRVELTRSAEKDVRRLRPWTERAVEALARLEEDPHRGHPLAGSLRGMWSLEFSLPGGAYRAAYMVVSDERVCVVFLIGPHEGFYQRATRRAAEIERRRREHLVQRKSRRQRACSRGHVSVIIVR